MGNIVKVIKDIAINIKKEAEIVRNFNLTRGGVMKRVVVHISSVELVAKND